MSLSLCLFDEDGRTIRPSTPYPHNAVVAVMPIEAIEATEAVKAIEAIKVMEAMEAVTPQPAKPNSLGCKLKWALKAVKAYLRKLDCIRLVHHERPAPKAARATMPHSHTKLVSNVDITIIVQPTKKSKAFKSRLPTWHKKANKVAIVA